MDSVVRKSYLCILLMFLFFTSCSDSIHTENFKSPEINALPGGNIDIAQYAGKTFYAAGWAADKEDGVAVPKVMVYVDNKLLGKASPGLERPDVASHFNNPAWTKSGWDIKANIPLNKGKHIAYAVVYDRMEAFSKSPEREFTVN